MQMAATTPPGAPPTKRMTTVSFRIAKHAVVSVVAALCGGALALLNAIYLSQYWIELGWRRPVGEWLNEVGVGNVYLGIVWILLPEWLIAVFLGVCAGLLLRKRWAIGAIPCALAFALADDVFLFVLGEQNPVVWFGPDAVLQHALWKCLAAVFLVLAAFCASGTGDDNPGKHERES